MNALRTTINNRIRRAATTLAAFALAIQFAGCGGGGSGGDGGSSESGAGSAGGGIPSNPEAEAAFWAKAEQHWLKTDKGWVSEFVEQLPLNPPKRVLKQYRDLKFGFVTRKLTESDRLNNIEWIGWTDFNRTPMRWWNEEAGVEYPKGWSSWRDEAPTNRVTVVKQNGKWIVEDNELLGFFEGVKPSPGSIPEG